MTPTLLLALCARPLLHGYAIRRFRRHRDLLNLDEIRSAADEGLLEACRRFDPEKGTFIAFARFWVRRQVQRAVLQELVWQRQRVGEGDEVFEEAVGELENDERLEEQVAARDLVSRLPRVEHDMWAMHATGRSLRELARAYNISIRQVRQRMDRGRQAIVPPQDASPMDRSGPSRSVHSRERRRRS